MTANSRIVLALCKGLILAVIAGLVAAAVSHDLELLRASPNKRGAYPEMIYGTCTMPGVGVAGADFADIYWSAKALRYGESAYHATTPDFADPFGRPKNYPSLMYWLYVPLARLEFWPALVVHTVFSFLAVFAASAFVLWKADCQRYIGPVLLAQASLFFLTPVGATDFERGQFDLLVAAIVALCFACSFVNRGVLVLAIVTGIAGALKWTSLPFLGCFSAFGFLLNSGRRRWAFFVLPWMTLLSTVVFWRGLQEYWSSIRYFDLDASPTGITLRDFFASALRQVVADCAHARARSSCVDSVTVRLRATPAVRGRKRAASSGPYQPGDLLCHYFVRVPHRDDSRNVTRCRRLG